MRCLALVPLLLPCLLAQEPGGEPHGKSRHGSEFDEGPRTAAYRMAGMSDQVHLPVAGLDAEAQALFDQGVTQLHGFWYFEAERSFREVARRFPDCAMAHWGMALCNFENEPRAAQCIANAVARSAAVPRCEQLWIDAFATFHGVDDAARGELRSGDQARVQKAKDALAAANKDRGKDAHAKAYKQLLKDLGTLVYEFPDDVEAKAFLAVYIWHAYDWGAGIPIVSHTAVDALLDQVFAKAPRHPAHHYRIHLWDAEKAERALASCAAIGASAPAIAHQWHMAGHIYDKLHRHGEAAWQQEASGRADHAHMMRDRVMPFLIHNYGHNQGWLAGSLACLGRGDEALAIAKNLAELPRHPKFNKLEDGDSIAGEARRRLVQVCEDLELWDAAVRLCHDGHLEAGDSVKAEVQRLGLLGRALFRLGRLDEAEQVVADADALLVRARARRAEALDKAEGEAFAKKEPANKLVEAMAAAGREPSNSVRSVLDLQRELRGERLLATGDAKGALAEFEAVADLPKTLLADAHVATGQPAKAIELLEKEVKGDPHRLPTLGRLLLACAASDTPEHKQRARDLMTEVTALTGTTEAELTATPLLRRVGIGVTVRGRNTPIDWSDPATFPADFGARPPLASLGPKTWQPWPNAGFDLPCTDGRRRTLAPAGGRATLVVFYLGFGCLHCVKQLEALSPQAAAFAALGVDVVAIGNESLVSTQEKLAALGDAKFAFPLLADPDLAAFRAWHCHDDFEALPLHGTFLVDAGGRVRWQDIGAEPFEQFDWLLTEARRLLRLPAGP